MFNAVLALVLILGCSVKAVAERPWRRPRDVKGRYIKRLSVSEHRPRGEVPSSARPGPGRIGPRILRV